MTQSWPSNDWYHFSIYIIDYDLNIFWRRQPLGYSDVTCSMLTENKLWHHPFLMRCITSSALIYASKKLIKPTKRIILCLYHSYYTLISSLYFLWLKEYSFVHIKLEELLTHDVSGYFNRNKWLCDVHNNKEPWLRKILTKKILWSVVMALRFLLHAKVFAIVFCF